MVEALLLWRFLCWFNSQQRQQRLIQINKHHLLSSSALLIAAYSYCTAGGTVGWWTYENWSVHNDLSSATEHQWPCSGSTCSCRKQCFEAHSSCPMFAHTGTPQGWRVSGRCSLQRLDEIKSRAREVPCFRLLSPLVFLSKQCFLI